MSEPTISELVERVREGLGHERPSYAGGLAALTALQSRCEEPDQAYRELNALLDEAIDREKVLEARVEEMERENEAIVSEYRQEREILKLASDYENKREAIIRAERAEAEVQKLTEALHEEHREVERRVAEVQRLNAAIDEIEQTGGTLLLGDRFPPPVALSEEPR